MDARCGGQCAGAANHPGQASHQLFHHGKKPALEIQYGAEVQGHVCATRTADPSGRVQIALCTSAAPRPTVNKADYIARRCSRTRPVAVLVGFGTINEMLEREPVLSLCATRGEISHDLGRV